jgi:hypothetical protein
MKSFSKIFSATLIGFNTAVISLIGGPVLTIILAITFNSGFSIPSLMNFLKSASVIGAPLFSLIFSIYCYRRERYEISILVGIIIFITIIALFVINYLDYASMIMN